MDIYDFGLRLKELREKRGFSQKDVAEKIGVERATISGYERNTTTPSLDALIKLAVLYNCSTDYLLGLVDRKYFYLDGLSSSQQATILDVVDTLVNEFKNSRITDI